MNAPKSGGPADECAGDGENKDECGAVPPSHRNGVFIALLDEVVGMVGLEGLVVDNGMRLERVAEAAQRPVHHIFVEQPLEK